MHILRMFLCPREGSNLSLSILYPPGAYTNVCIRAHTEDVNAVEFLHKLDLLRIYSVDYVNKKKKKLLQLHGLVWIIVHCYFLIKVNRENPQQIRNIN